MNSVQSELTPDTKNQLLESPTGQLSTWWLRSARIGWVILAVLAIAVLLTSLPGYALRITRGLSGHGPTAGSSTGYILLQAINVIASLASAVLSLILSRLLYRQKFENPAVAAVSFYLLLYGTIMTGPLEVWVAYWIGSSQIVINLQSLLMATPTLAMLVLFPNGKFVPGWTRWVLVASVPWNIITMLVPIFPVREDRFAGLIILAGLWVGLLGVGVYAQIFRYRRVSNLDERQQTKWVLFGFVLWLGYILISTYPYFYIESLPSGSAVPWWSPVSELGWWLSLNIIPVAMAVAITRSRLWNIDIVVNRTLVYGALTFITMILYILVVGALGNLLQVGNSSFIAFLTTGLVAVLFQPLRERLQGWVNRLMYGDRDDPVAVLTNLGKQLERTGSPDDALSGIVETVARALKLPYAAIELGETGDLAASYGIARDITMRLPLSYQSETTGYLVVSTRSPGEAFSSSDMQLLENIAHQAGAAAHAAKLTTDLRLSRQKLVAAREEERRRLRRDLHDGLGPNLASLTLKLDATRNLLKRDSQKAEQLIDELKKQTQSTIQDIRDLVYELRPPALDDFGLVEAIRQFIDRQAANQPRIRLEVPGPLPTLPAAIEVAGYRIALEGLTNVLRHANASKSTVRISLVQNQLVLEVIDDGVGLPDTFSPGVGLRSMRERAEELGGRFEVLPGESGTHIRASLPLIKE